MINNLLGSNKVIITNNDNKNKLLLLKSNIINHTTIKSYNEFISDFVSDLSTKKYIELGSENGFYLADTIYKYSYIVSDKLQNNKANNFEKNYISYEKIDNYKNGIIVLDYYYDNDLFNYLIDEISDKVPVRFVYHYLDNVKKINLSYFKTQKEEVYNLGYIISKMMYNGCKLEKINIISLNREYDNLLNEIFSIYKIPYISNIKTSLFEYKSVKYFIKFLLNNKEKEFDKLFKDYEFYADEGTDKLIKIVNKYIGNDFITGSIVDGFIYEVKNTFINNEKTYGIKVLNDYNYLFDEDETIFIIGVNQDIIPKVYKDDDYFSDREKEILGVKTSTFKNKYEKIKFNNFVRNYKNIYLSYSLSSFDRGYIRSSILNDFDDLEVVDFKNENYLESYNERYSKLRFNQLLDDFNKYNIVSEELKALNNAIDNRKFSNGNKTIKSKKLKEKLENGMILSYTSISEYYKCPYSFYLNRVLRIRKTSSNDNLFIGNLFHDVLYNMLLEEKEYSQDDVLEMINNYYLKIGEMIDNKEKLFIDIYSFYLFNVYNYIKKISTRTIFKLDGVEKEYNIPLNKDNYLLTGKIDKVMRCTIKGKEYVLVLDYKTGTSDIDLNKIIHGFDMQLLFYFYLISKEENVEFAGGYLQHILPRNIIKSEKEKSYIDLLDEFYKYHGYTNTDITVISSIDRDFDKDSYIDKLKFLKDSTELTSNARKKAITNDEYYKLLEIVYKKIDDACLNIYDGKFDIRPAYIDELVCKNCNYCDICYYKDDNIDYKEKYKDLSFLKEDGHDSSKTE